MTWLAVSRAVALTRSGVPGRGAGASCWSIWPYLQWRPGPRRLGRPGQPCRSLSRSGGTGSGKIIQPCWPLSTHSPSTRTAHMSAGRRDILVKKPVSSRLSHKKTAGQLRLPASGNAGHRPHLTPVKTVPQDRLPVLRRGGMEHLTAGFLHDEHRAPSPARPGPLARQGSTHFGDPPVIYGETAGCGQSLGGASETIRSGSLTPGTADGAPGSSSSNSIHWSSPGSSTTHSYAGSHSASSGTCPKSQPRRAYSYPSRASLSARAAAAAAS